MKVQAKTLLLLAGLVWTAAGGNILRIGLETYGPYVNWTNGLISLAVFAVFWIFVFSRLVKNTRHASPDTKTGSISGAFSTAGPLRSWRE